MVRFLSVLIVAQQLRKHLKGGFSSSFTMTTGGLSQRPRKDWTIVMSYLTGLQGMCRALARDLAPISVKWVGPRPVDTELWNSHWEKGDLDELRSNIVSTMATQTFGKVEDVVESFLYLITDKNATGSIVYTNGEGLLV